MNNMNIVVTATALTMSSREIADLTGKEHDNVRRDIKNMADSLSLSFEEKTEASSGGRPSKVYLLPKRECLILVSGYSVELRARIIDRWMELEATVTNAPVAYSIPDIVALAVEAIRKGDEARERAIEERLLARLSEGTYVQNGKTPGEIWRICGFPQIKGVAKWFGNRLEDAGCATGGRKGNETSRARAYDFDKARKWLNNGGRFLVEQKIAERRGQGKLQLVGKAGA